MSQLFPSEGSFGLEKDGSTPPAHPQDWTQRQGRQLSTALPTRRGGGGGGGAQNDEPLPSLILGKSSRGQRLPSPPPEPPCGFGVKVEATSHHKNGGTCSIHGGGGGGGHLGNVPREAPAVLPAASRVVPWALEA